jgi:hypothetical protein
VGVASSRIKVPGAKNKGSSEQRERGGGIVNCVNCMWEAEYDPHAYTAQHAEGGAREHHSEL